MGHGFGIVVTQMTIWESINDLCPRGQEGLDSCNRVSGYVLPNIYIYIYIYIHTTQPRGLVIETVPTPLRYTTPLCCDRGACDYGPLGANL